MEYIVDRSQPVGFVTKTLAAELRRGITGAMTISSVQNEHHSEPVFMASTIGHVALPGDPLELPYKNWRGEISTRKIQPIRLAFSSTDWHPEPQWLLIAWDLEKDAERSFALKDFNPAPDPAPSSPDLETAVLHFLVEMLGGHSINLVRRAGTPEAEDLLGFSVGRGRSFAIRDLLDIIAKAGAEKAAVKTAPAVAVKALRLDKNKPEFDEFDKGWEACLDAISSLLSHPSCDKRIRSALSTQVQDAPRDNRPCTMDAFVAALFEANSDHYDREDAIDAWLHGEWEKALSVLPEKARAELTKGGA